MTGHPGFGSRHGLEATEGSVVTLANCTVEGGDGIVGLSPGASAVRADGSVVSVRGSSLDHLVPGWGEAGGGLGPAAPVDGAGSLVDVSGVTVVNGPLAPWVRQPSPALPTLQLTGNLAPGGKGAIEVRGPVGGLVFVVISDVPRIIPTPVGTVWFDPGWTIAVVWSFTHGQETPTSWPLDAPVAPSLVGVSVVLQGWLPPGPSTPEQLTNASNLIFGI
jgi:hypothetical protein